MNKFFYASISFLMAFCFFVQSCTSEHKKPLPVEEKVLENIPLFSEVPYTESGVDFVNKLRQTLQINILTFKYFYNGGGVALGDVNNDGLTDLYFTGNLGPNRLFLNQGNFKFIDVTRTTGVDGGQGWTNGAVMVDINNDGWLDIYVCRSGNLEPEQRANQLFINNKDGSFTNKVAEYGLDDTGYSTHVTFFDYDLDGAEETSMISSAVWMDVNQDNQMDLIIAGEWMPITVLLHKEGKFELSDAHDLENSEGWWFSLEKVDIDNDGDLDLIAGNLGLNYKYKTSELEPFQVYCHDFDSSGTLDIYLGYFQRGSLLPVRGKECSTQQMPYISKKFKTYDAFAKAPLIEILGDGAKEALHYQAKPLPPLSLKTLETGSLRPENCLRNRSSLQSMEL